MSRLEGREIWLVAERGFPYVENEHHAKIDWRSLSDSPDVQTPLTAWYDYLRSDLESQHDQAVLAGLRATTAIARYFEYQKAVFLVMSDPRVGEWFTIQALRTT